MTDRITRQACRAMRRAWAVEYGITNFADCQFLGILGESTCVAARTLARLGLDLRQARRDALEIARGRSVPAAGQVAATGKGWLRAVEQVDGRGGRPAAAAWTRPTSCSASSTTAAPPAAPSPARA